MWVGGWAVGLNDDNAILNSVEVVVEVGVELGKKQRRLNNQIINDFLSSLALEPRVLGGCDIQQTH